MRTYYHYCVNILTWDEDKQEYKLWFIQSFSSKQNYEIWRVVHCEKICYHRHKGQASNRTNQCKCITIPMHASGDVLRKVV